MPAPVMTKPARPSAVARNTKSPPFKRKAAPNASILSFFKKAPPPEEPMFVSELSDFAGCRPAGAIEERRPNEPEMLEVPEEPEGNTPSLAVKRQKLDTERSIAETGKQNATASKGTQRGPFLDDSDDDGDETSSAAEVKPEMTTPALSDQPILNTAGGQGSFDALLRQPEPGPESEMLDDHVDALWADLDEDDSFDGEEFRERQYMEQQGALEATEAREATEALQRGGSTSSVASCPICNTSLAGSSASAATVHVNQCLDGMSVQEPPPDRTESKQAASAFSARFARVRAPRPGQANPISLDTPGTDAPGGSGTAVAPSAFAKLMSGHAENAAWATAAAAETAARGRPSHERTCPFYKIMPGLAICVDAFRYGAVEGCRAYFLSHFHSDHYIGLTARWSHGPIYCSRVTASLVHQQLGTAAQWVVPLDFDVTVDVPGTAGVQVTLIPANHCPGSAMFLFARRLPGGSGSRTHRILHCGDFRACPAHVQHALLRPQTRDAVAGTTRQQRIDVCYLDTTYLSPRYAFPPQHEVVRACAALCAALDGSMRAGDDTVWERLLGKKGATSALFARDDSTSATVTAAPSPPRRLLVVCGTYSIGKERICIAIAEALGSRIYAAPAKMRILQQLDDPTLAALLTADPTAAQVHMQTLAEMRPDTLAAYREAYGAHFSRVVGFRPSGWTFRPGAPASAGTAAGTAPGSIPTTTLLHGAHWRTRFAVADLQPQRGCTHEALCFGVPYSEHSSFRELALFIMALRIEKVVPTVNVGSEQSRRRMKGWLDRWVAERRRGGVVEVLAAEEAEAEAEQLMWDGKDGKGGGAYW